MVQSKCRKICNSSYGNKQVCKVKSLKGYHFKIYNLHIQTFVIDGQTRRQQEGSHKSYVNSQINMCIY
jgi:hypothetical protein